MLKPLKLHQRKSSVSLFSTKSNLPQIVNIVSQQLISFFFINFLCKNNTSIIFLSLVFLYKLCLLFTVTVSARMVLPKYAVSIDTHSALVEVDFRIWQTSGLQPLERDVYHSWRFPTLLRVDTRRMSRQNIVKKNRLNFQETCTSFDF